MADLAERYKREHVAMHCKPNTVKHYGLMLKKHIVPSLGELRVSEMEKKPILRFQVGLSHMPTVANRTVDILMKTLDMAELWEMLPPGKNPRRSVRRNKVDPQKERFLTPKELARLGRTFEIAPEKLLASRCAAAIRLPVLIGCRRNEIMGLAWDDLDFEAGGMRLADSKAGPCIVSMRPAAAVLAELPRVSGNRWVFPGRKKGTHQANIEDPRTGTRARGGRSDGAFPAHPCSGALQGGTADACRRVLRCHILPVLDAMPLTGGGRGEVAELHHALCDRLSTANMTMRVLSKMLSQAEAWDPVPPGSNPCRFVRQYRRQTRERFLTVEELRRLRRARSTSKSLPQCICCC